MHACEPAGCEIVAPCFDHETIDARRAHVTTTPSAKGNFGGVRELTAAIEVHLSRCKLEPQPYLWCAQPADILAKLERAREVEAAKGVAR
jgi:hypothetical protein